MGFTTFNFDLKIQIGSSSSVTEPELHELGTQEMKKETSHKFSQLIEGFR